MVWNSGGLDWQALDVLAEIHGASDPAILVAELLAIRRFMEQQRG